ncbi:MAG TPA: hypothetical protein VFK70_12955, partial [Vicinamibacteria bacterium]|nr:hypothetical protein [Vicinamibacteria bacterium]
MSSEKQPTAASRWERRDKEITEYGPYVLLAISTILAMVIWSGPPEKRLVTLAVAALAAAWIYVVFTRSPLPRQTHRPRMIVYILGLLVFFAVLMWLHVFFFIFAITGFF